MISSVITAVKLVKGTINGTRQWETPGALIDLTSYEVLLFPINPQVQSRSKGIVKNDHVIPGRHGPLMEPVAGAAEVLTFDLIFTGFDPAGYTQVITAVNWIESLMFPTKTGAIDAVRRAVSGDFSRKSLPVKGVGRPVILSYGLWIPERRFLVTNVTTKSGPGQHPIFLTPTRVVCSVTLQEDEQENQDYISRRFLGGVSM